MSRKKLPEGSYVSEEVMFLHCTPGDSGEGPISIVAVAGKHTGTITHVSLTPQDARTLVTRLLGSLYSSNDRTAERILESNFATDQFGHFNWPPDEEDWLGVEK